MLIKTPKFWFKNKSEISPFYFYLRPLSKIWEITTKYRLNKGIWEKMPIPVICIGNLIAGGSGKTPVTMAFQILLNDMGIRSCVVSRGYRGKIKGPHYVNETDNFDTVGDEPLLLSKKGVVIVSKNRRDGVLKAHKDGFDVALLDDGFQNPQIKKDLSFVVIDSSILFGNEYIIPLGPLRETIQSGLSRADGIISVVNNHGNDDDITRLGKEYKIPIYNGFFDVKKNLENCQNQRVLAFSGIGYPDKFFNTLKRLGYKIVKTKIFPDHYPYTLRDIINLEKCSRNLSSKLITTEKDLIRIPYKFHKLIDIIKIEYKFTDDKSIRRQVNKLKIKD